MFKTVLNNICQRLLVINETMYWLCCNAFVCRTCNMRMIFRYVCSLQFVLRNSKDNSFALVTILSSIKAGSIRCQLIFTSIHYLILAYHFRISYFTGNMLLTSTQVMYPQTLCSKYLPCVFRDNNSALPDGLLIIASEIMKKNLSRIWDRRYIYVFMYHCWGPRLRGTNNSHDYCITLRVMELSLHRVEKTFDFSLSLGASDIRIWFKDAENSYSPRLQPSPVQQLFW